MIDLPRDWDGLAIQPDEAVERDRTNPGIIKALLGRLAARSARQKEGVYFSGYIFNKRGKPIRFYPDRPESINPPEGQTASHLGQ